jgi:hypothetical protein
MIREEEYLMITMSMGETLKNAARPFIGSDTIPKNPNGSVVEFKG